MNQRRLTSRDYKGAQRSSFNLHRWRDFGAGLALGLAAALAIYVGDHRGQKPLQEVVPPPAAATEPAAPAGTSTEETDFSFYDRLPKFEVVVPEKERSARVSSATKIEKPGTYYLQIGSYRDADEAQRVQSQLARQDMSASVQRIAVDNDVWHRVRIGPIKDLQELNQLRAKLQAAELPVLVVNVTE